jgi:hypothetical protein
MSGVADVEAIEPPNRIAEERCLTPARRGLQLRELVGSELIERDLERNPCHDRCLSSPRSFAMRWRSQH